MPVPNAGAWGRQKPPPSSQVLPGHALAAGLAGSWPFNEAGGLATLDASDRTASAGAFSTFSTARPTWATGRFGPGVSFPGNTGGSGAVTLPAIPGTFTAASVVMWLRNVANVPGNNNNTGLVRLTSDATLRSHYPFTDGIIYLSLLRPGRVTVGNVGVDKSQWHQLAVTSSPTAYKVYQNGVEVFTGSSPGSFSFTGGNYIGASENVYNYQGTIDHLHLWTGRALTAAEVKALYAEPFAFYAPPGPRRAYFLPPPLAVAAAPPPPSRSRMNYARFGRR